MLSILIPVYNYDVRSLVEDLFFQCKDQNIDFEIICMDDASEESFKQLNSNVVESEKISFHYLEQNIGRAAIRNKLVEKSTFNWLLFLDCDTGVPDGLFIKRYIKARHMANVIVGGRIYGSSPPEDLSYYFHWKYGSRREVKTAEQRSIAPYEGFMTNNFLIEKSVFKTIQFDKGHTGYGHEDTLFGQELKKSAISIAHIENPAIHLGLENTESFIQKSKTALDNLLKIQSKGVNLNTKIFNKYTQYQSIINWLTTFFPSSFERLIVKNLNSSRPSLKLFDFYRLLYLSNAQKSI